MGYDIYGLNPREMVTKPEILDKDWTKLGKKQTDKYFEAMNKHQDENPGTYFRNNVWWCSHYGIMYVKYVKML